MVFPATRQGGFSNVVPFFSWDTINQPSYPRGCLKFSGKSSNRHLTRNCPTRCVIMFHRIINPVEKLVPIPTTFHALYDGPFQHCIDCECSLITSDKQYIVERIFRGSEPILEYALCEDCHQKILQELSRESLEAIEAFFVERMDYPRRAALANPDPDAALDEWIGHCCVSLEPAVNCHEHQIVALCQGDQMVLGPSSPMMISGAVVEEVAEKLSRSTRDQLDDFVGTHFGMPSDFCDTPTPILI